MTLRDDHWPARRVKHPRDLDHRWLTLVGAVRVAKRARLRPVGRLLAAVEAGFLADLPLMQDQKAGSKEEVSYRRTVAVPGSETTVVLKVAEYHFEYHFWGLRRNGWIVRVTPTPLHSLTSSRGETL
jgi:hypothetical protein